MVRGNIQRFEVVIVVLDLRALCDLVSDIDEERLDARQGAGHRMQTAALHPAPIQGNVDGFRRQLGGDGGLLKLGLAALDQRLDPLLGLIDPGPGGGALLGSELAEAFQQLGELALLAQVFNPHLIKGGFIRRGIGSGDGFVGEGRQVFHCCFLWQKAVGDNVSSDNGARTRASPCRPCPLESTAVTHHSA